MTLQELSNSFDLLLRQNVYDFNRENSNIAERIDEYEKSIFLTKAQEEIYNELYRNYDRDEYAKRALNALVKASNVLSDDMSTNGSSIFLSDYNGVSVPLNDDVAFILNEQVKLASGANINVKPIDIDDYNVIRNNPFQKPNKRKILRTEVDFTAEDVNYEIELITSYEISDIDKYKYTYLSYPKPIIVTDLSDHNLTIGGINTTSEPSLAPITHELILNKAVELAINSLALYNNSK